jgi:glycerate kinase
VLSDVQSPLLGPDGAATIFGPQKGANLADIHVLDNALAEFARLLGGDPSQPGAGAAGGTAFGLCAAWGATIRSGAESIAQITGLADAVSEADIVITGEGRFDSQSFLGKSVGHTLHLANNHRERPAPLTNRDGYGRRPQAWVIAGEIDEAFRATIFRTDPRRIVPLTVSLSTIAGTTAAARADPLRWLRRAGSVAAVATGELQQRFRQPPSAAR